MARIFTESEILDMRDKWHNGMLDVRLTARFYNVGTETIRRAVRGDTYAQYGGLPDTPVDHRYPANVQAMKVDMGAAAAASLRRLQEMLGEVQAAPKEETMTRRSMPVDPFDAGGLDDPGEGRVLE